MRNHRWVRPSALLLVLATLAPAEPGRSSDLLFARLTTERKELFLQEIVEFNLSVYSSGLNLGRELSLSNRETPGLNFLPFQDRGGTREAVDGRTYDVRRFLGRAQAVAAGSFTIHPSVLVEIVVPPRSPDGRSGARAEVRRADFSPPPLTIEVQPLPDAGKPEGFTGAVGSFTFSATAKPAAVAEGEPVTLTMEIRGRGNIESVAAPRVQAGDRFKLYEPKLLRREIGEDRSGGRLVFEQIIVPRSPGATPLPEVVFSYFDPAQKSYRKLADGPFPLLVTPAVHPGAPAVEAASRRAAAGRPAPRVDIAPLKPAPEGRTLFPERSWHTSFWFLALQFIPLGVVVALYLSARRRDAMARDVVAARRQLAPNAGRTGIAAAEQALRDGDAPRFHEALWEALSSYFGHRLNLRPGEISGETVVGRLAGAGLDPADLSRLEEIFSLSEQERFGRPLSGSASLSTSDRQRLAGLLDDVGRLLQACDKAGL
jgi:hypothetical protein